ncbi:metal ABC transporter ATP-binding protein [Arthrobacter sp. TES]|uniref:metal ABC transporter ATP-binding protein n=1 Tax=Paenarthrobacter TaxID=1742992 RepID=UPI0004CE9FDA|nr:MULTISPECIES: metal ABC transporter ATP-binding protein [Paenarthrobacter]MCX8452605.1 metal ABC transporter ATP-binding protein [Paenarthrobacter ureafaciens]MCY0971243.1 metal ABC transporter ATP-binding protein [Paenarthrobacter ureafaciens]QOI62802.1 metal ABC transporter ATP-binding protein [Arthrobacter sp. TES]QQQ61230.1 metal ABC transporter ATP-binding protein [Paenarthrobacter ureafaciens]
MDRGQLLTPVVSLREASLQFGKRTLWKGLDLDISPGEFFAVLGPNGSGKTSFLKVLLGLQELQSGTVTLGGRPVERGSRTIGYIPQQKSFAPDTPLRARDLVALGIDGHRWGVRLGSGKVNRRVDELLELVGASDYAKVPVGQLSGGEQQRLRVAQALATDPAVLLCDEPLLSLDLNHQQGVSALINEQCHKRNSAVVFVTHEINPVIDYVDRVLYLAGGRFRVGTPQEVMTTDVLSDLYNSHVEVIQTNGRFVVVGLPDATTHFHDDAHTAAGEEF